MKKDNKLFVGANSDLATKGVILAISCLLAVVFGRKTDKKKSKRKNRGVVYRTRRNFNTLNSLVGAFYVNKLKNEIDPEDFPVKMENAEIIDI